MEKKSYVAVKLDAELSLCFISELECGGKCILVGANEMTSQHCKHFKHKVHCIMCNWDSLASLGNVFGVCNTSWENDEIGRP